MSIAGLYQPRRRRAALVVAIFAAAGMALATSAQAAPRSSEPGASGPRSLAPDSSACDPSTGSGHCYTEAIANDTVAMSNWSAHVQLTCFRSYSGEFVTNEIWAYTGGAKYGEYWVETGEFSQDASDTVEWFWADQRPGGGYHEHDGGPSTQTFVEYSAALHYHGSNEWVVERGDVGTVGISTSNPGPSYGAQAGLEYSDAYERGRGYAHGMEYALYTQYTNHLGWPGVYSYQSPTNSVQSYHGSLSGTANSYYDGYSNLCITGAVISPSHSAPSGPATKTDPKAVALHWAALNGDPGAKVTATTTSLRKAAVKEQTGGADLVTGNPSVVTTVLAGHFVGHMAKVPKGASLPSGQHLTVSVDPATNEITDWSISR